MRIALVGNHDNNNYRVCKWMRALGIDAELYHFEINAIASGKRSRPELVDPELANGYPEWLHVIPGRPNIIRNQQKQLDEIRKKTDLVLTSGGVAVRVIHFLGVENIFHYAIGAEINTSPWKPIEEQEKLHAKLAQWRYRKNLDLIKGIFADYKPMIQQLEKHGLRDKLILWSTPEDVEGNRAKLNKALRAELMEKYGSFKRLFLWLSRLNMDPTTVDYKGPEMFAEAVSALKSSRGLDGIKLIVGQHGSHVEGFKALADKLDIAEHIDWVDHLDFRDLHAYLSLDNAVVFDELAPLMDELSGMAREAISVGGVVVKALDFEHISQYYGPSCPSIHANNAALCYEAMVRLLDDREFLSVRDATDRWSREYLHYPRAIMAMMGAMLERSTPSVRETAW
jgi:hypothetical protein